MPLFTPSSTAPAPAILSNDAVDFSGVNSGTPTANNVYVWAFEVATTITITAARWRNGSTATGHTNMALYDSSKNLVSGSDTGAQANVASSANTFTYSSSFSIGPGQYYMALACDNSTDTYLSNTLNSTSTPMTRARKAANALSAGAMPSALGSLSAVSFTPSMTFLVSGGLG